jgi:glycerophosphoryl diester phosphodiesterase
MALRLLQQLAPSSCRGLTWDFSSWPDHDLLRSLGLCYFNPHWTLLSEKLVMTMHDQGYLVSAWTVDDSSAMKKLIDWHVDALVTNDIGRLRTAISVFASNGDGR